MDITPGRIEGIKGVARLDADTIEVTAVKDEATVSFRIKRTGGMPGNVIAPEAFDQLERQLREQIDPAC